MCRLHVGVLCCSLLLGCTAKEPPAPAVDLPAATSGPKSAAAATGNEAAPKPPPEPQQCEGLLLPDDLSLRQTSQGSHAAAASDITLDLKSGKMTGSDYTLADDGNTPVPLQVDQQLSPEQLAAVRERFDKTCAPRRVADKPEYSAPGGSSMFEIKHADGSSLFVITGASNLAAGAQVAEVAREDWLRLFKVWPKTQGK